MAISRILKTGLWIGVFCLSVAMLTFFLYFYVTSRYPIGGDFLVYWNSAKALFLEHISPYSSLVSARNQIALYGRPALTGEDQVRFVYLPFSLIAIAPAVFMTYALADAFWIAFNFIALFAAVIFTFPRVPRWVILSMVFFLPVARSLILGQYSLLLGTCLIFIYGLIGHERTVSYPHQWAGGILLAWCLTKPQLTILLIAFFLFNSIRRRLWGVCYGLVSGCLVFGLMSFLWVSGWIDEWVTAVTSYIGYVPIQPLYRVYSSGLFPVPWDGWVGVGILMAATTAVLFFANKWWHDPKYDALLLMSLAVLGQIISPNPKSMISDQILFLLPLLIWIVYRTSRYRWEKPLWWTIFILSVWVAFIVFFTGQEPLQAEATLPLVGGAWLVWVYFMDSTPSSRREVVA